MSKIRVGILGYDGVAAINLVGPLEAFSNAVKMKGEQTAAAYDVGIIACEGDRFVADSGLTFHATPNYSEDEPFDTVIVPGGRGMSQEQIIAQVAAWITAHAQTTRRIASVCTGVYALASTGLLDRRRVTTHWQNALDVAVRFPNLRVEESALVLKDGKFYSTAGATAGIDLALFLITEDYGHDTALAVARKLLVYVERAGGQEQYAEPSRPDAHVGPVTHELHTNRMGRLVNWIAKHLAQDLTLEILAKRAVLSKNDFVQQFTQTFGVPPALFVKNLRLNEARRRLMTGQEAAAVARSLGFADPAYFIQEFRRRFGLLPSDYQQRFGCTVTPAGFHRRRNGFSERNHSTPNRATRRRRPRITSFTRCIRRHAGGEPDMALTEYQ